ncbi:MAG: (Fe-S)-binding protein [Acidimicrobiales bacterium]
MPLRIAIGLAATAVGIALVGHRAWFLWRLVSGGAPEPGRLGNVVGALKAEVADVFGQRKLLKRSVPGIAHFFMFWGFIALLFTIIEVYGDLFNPGFAIPAIGTSSGLGFVEDFFAVAVLAAVVVFSIIRLTQSPARRERSSRFYGSHTGAAWAVLGLIFLVVATLLLYRGAQVDTGHFPYDHSWWTFASHGVGDALSVFGGANGANAGIETAFILAQIAVIWGFFVLVVNSKHLHIFVSEANVAAKRRPEGLGALRTTLDLDPEHLTEESSFGYGKVADLSWKTRLDLLSCTECGRCQDSCPAWVTDKPLSPKLVITDLRDHLMASAPELIGRGARAGPRADGATTDGASTDAAPANGAATPAPSVAGKSLVPDVIEPDAIWSCTTCGACVEQCPVDIEQLDTIVDLRRYQVLMESEFPSEAGTMLRNVENQGDPWGMGASHRLDWAEGLPFEVPVVGDRIGDDVEYLLWVGCAGALDERARKATRSVASLLHRAGVSFAVLGRKESCTGDPARRIGNEYLFQTQAQANIETLHSVGARKVVAWCPHCFNTLANEYPALGGDFEVLHHTQVLDQLVAAGRLVPTRAVAKSLTYHDPCYLARHNDVREPPRSVLGAVPDLESVEMHRHGKRTFCCGAGGSRMWMEERIGSRINLNRTDEAISTGAEVVGVACPYCMIMLDDAVKQRQADGSAPESLRVLDVSQVLEASLGDGDGPGSPALPLEAAISPPAPEGQGSAPGSSPDPPPGD